MKKKSNFGRNLKFMVFLVLFFTFVTFGGFES